MIITHPDQLDALPNESTVLAGESRWEKTPEGWRRWWGSRESAYKVQAEAVMLSGPVYLLHAEARTVEDLDRLLDRAVVWWVGTATEKDCYADRTEWLSSGDEYETLPDTLIGDGPASILHPGTPA